MRLQTPMLLTTFTTEIQKIAARIPKLHKVGYYHYKVYVKSAHFDMENANSEKQTVVKSEKSADIKLSKRAQKLLLRKEKERRRKEAKSSQHLKDSMSNSSDVLKDDALMKETEYYFQKGLRKVYPYYYEFAAYCKGRWVGRKIVDVFTSEFKYTATPLVESIESGLITVNGEKTCAEYKLKDNDYIRNKIHRHELPVVADEIEVVADTDQVLVVNKPSSIPIHPCGRYHYNSLPYILAEKTGYKNLRSIYRLDRLTSGVVIFCKVEGLARTMIDQIKDRKVQKEYICRVEGEFPSGTIECHEPLDIFSPKAGLHKVTENGKPAHTTFERMSYNGFSSVVKCMPHTGRTHQIRVHLQFLGHPIVNDPLYNSELWGPNKGKGGQFGKSEKQLLEDLLKVHSEDKYLIESDNDTKTSGKESNTVTATSSNQNEPKESAINSCIKDESSGISQASSERVLSSESDKFSENEFTKADSCDTQEMSVRNSLKRTTDFENERELKVQKSDNGEKELPSGLGICSNPASITEDTTSNSSRTQNVTSGEQPSFDPSKMTFDNSCITCQQKFRDPLPEELVMFLHAYSYQGPGWKYTTSLPEWAHESWSNNS